MHAPVRATTPRAIRMSHLDNIQLHVDVLPRLLAAVPVTRHVQGDWSADAEVRPEDRAPRAASVAPLTLRLKTAS